MFTRMRRLLNVATKFDVVRWNGMHTAPSAIWKALNRYQIDCVIDVGANEGQFATQVRDLGYLGQLVSYEPVSDAFAKLTINRSSDKRCRIYNCALGSEETEADINVSAFSSFSSFYGTTDFARANWPTSRVCSVERVPIKTLDSELSTGKLAEFQSCLLKIDTQGYDLEVMKGAETLLSKCPVIFTEVSFRKVYEHSPSSLETLEYFASRGYYPAGIYAITRTQDLSMNEADVLFVRRAEI